MKIALLIQNADRRAGGAESYTIDLARALRARGHQITVVAAEGPPAVAEEARATGFNVVYVGAEGRFRWKRIQDFVLRLKGLYDRKAYDIVHAMLPVYRCDVYQPHSGMALDNWKNSHLKYPRWIVRRWARRFNRFNFKRHGLARLEEEMMRQKPWLLCFSTAMRDFAREHYAIEDDKLVMMMNGIDLSRFEPSFGTRSRDAIRGEWKVDDDQALGLLIGNNWRLKGVQDAIQALTHIPERQIRLMVVGHDDPVPYIKLAEKLNVRDRVIFAGGVSDPRPLYGAADFLMLPTRRDTFSLVVLEAMAMGLPIITTRQNGASEVMQDGKQGILLQRGDPAALAQAMRQMLDRDRRRSMSQEVIAIRQQFSFEHHVGRVEGVYERVLASKAKPVPRGPSAAQQQA
jgi:UDP-glucose:(heptosyl)LPS alpha-1,3-glucosyltransferase